MASVNWEKCKNRATAKAVLRHCATDERLKNEHSNKDINKALTFRNVELVGGRTYEESCAAYEQRIAEIDTAAAARGAKKPRKDRVELLFLDIPAPDGMKDKDCKPFFSDVLEMFQQRYGKDNTISAYVHFDEVHDYIDPATGKTRRSRPHMHLALVPEIDGRMCAKEVCCLKSFNWANNSIERLSRDKYGLQYQDGSKKKSLDTVEALKNKSLKAENKRLETENAQKRSEIALEQEELERGKTTLAKERHALEAKSDALRAKEQELTEWEEMIKSKHRALDSRRERLDDREKDIQQREQQLQQAEQERARMVQLNAGMVQLNAELQALVVACREESRKKAAAMAKRVAQFTKDSRSPSVKATGLEISK